MPIEKYTYIVHKLTRGKQFERFTYLFFGIGLVFVFVEAQNTLMIKTVYWFKRPFWHSFIFHCDNDYVDIFWHVLNTFQSYQC